MLRVQSQKQISKDKAYEVLRRFGRIGYREQEGDSKYFKLLFKDVNDTEHFRERRRYENFNFISIDNK
jgi:hypothetical protein